MITKQSIILMVALLLGNGIAQPSVTIYGEIISLKATFEVYFSFSDSVTELTTSDIVASNAVVQSVSGEGLYFSASLKAQEPGTITVSLPAGTVKEIHGSQQNNTASNSFSVEVQYDKNVVSWKVDSDEEWQQSGSNSTGRSFEKGEAVPTASSATYSSITKTYTDKMDPQMLTFKQSPVWDNWTEVENVGPDSALNAPVFLSVANDDYYFLGAGPNKGYHAWHSTDMINWTDYGSVTPDGREDQWVTSAEYKDGLFYIIFDYPNDQDPHLYIDDNLKDGIVGTRIGMVFNDPSHGSDASLFRDDADSLFHMIYEDWSPIEARTHSWDSPLAGHTSSPDCINGFTPHKHKPPVDERTTPTGEIGYYHHGAFDEDLTYQIHSPDQNAYGDWTTIKVGSQYYLFSDFDHIDQHHLKVARFTSNSLYEEFEYVGLLGQGHPDPTTGFAEGQFYLITQKDVDLVSPGPWVEEVETRAGVDTNANGNIDVWSNWQVVKETYDHKPGFARVVDATAAQLDLSSLPNGFGFKFEYKVTDKTTNHSSPIMNNVEMSFKPANGILPVTANLLGHEKIISLERNEGIFKLHYKVEKMGLASFTFYNIQGKRIHTIKRFHGKIGGYSLDLMNEKNTSWKLLEYISPGGLTKKINLHQ